MFNFYLSKRNKAKKHVQFPEVNSMQKMTSISTPKAPLYIHFIINRDSAAKLIEHFKLIELIKELIKTKMEGRHWINILPVPILKSLLNAYTSFN